VTSSNEWFAGACYQFEDPCESGPHAGRDGEIEGRNRETRADIVFDATVGARMPMPSRQAWASCRPSDLNRVGRPTTLSVRSWLLLASSQGEEVDPEGRRKAPG
jgi:hypothetical protein